MIEETAFLWDLVLDGETPVIVTGAMRAASDANDDGPENLRDAVRCAASPTLRGAGVQRRPRRHDQPGRRGDEDARQRRSTRSSASTPGRSGGSSATGSVVERERGPRRHVATDRAAEGVQLLTAHVAMDGALLDAAAALRPPGIVVEATGAGNTAAAAARGGGRGRWSRGSSSRSPRAARPGAAGAGYAFPGGGATWVRAGALLAGHLVRPEGADRARAAGSAPGWTATASATLLADPPGWGPVARARRRDRRRPPRRAGTSA